MVEKNFIGINLSLSDIVNKDDKMIMEERKTEKKEGNKRESPMKSKSGE